MIDFDITQLEAFGIDTKTGLGFTGGKEKYLSALQRFYKAHDGNRSKVEAALGASDIENYTILVHALKSNAKMIGATALSTQFEELEMAGKAGDTDQISAKTKPALDAHTALVTHLKPLGEMEQVKAADEIGADEAKEVVSQLLDALDDFDDEGSAKLVAKLAGYPFRITQKSRLKEAADYIGDFMYDEAAEIIREIAAAIE